MTTFVHRTLPLSTVPAAGPPKPNAASAVFYPGDGIVEFAVPRDGGVPRSVQFSRALLIDGLARAGRGGRRTTSRLAPDAEDWVLLVVPIDGRPVEFPAVDEFVDASLALVPARPSRIVLSPDAQGEPGPVARGDRLRGGQRADALRNAHAPVTRAGF